MNASAEFKFWASIDMLPDLPGCWLWNGAVIGTKTGYTYGVIQLKGRSILAHRFSYELHHGPLQEGMQACHHCDTPACVRPDHLFQGTAHDNSIDCITKGRGNRTRGIQHQDAKITPDLIRRLRSGELTATQVAAIAGCHPNTARVAKRGDTWKHVINHH